jgi:hypothetical protein
VESSTGAVQQFAVVPEQSVVSLTTWNNLLVGGTSINGGEGILPTQTDARLFVWNPETQQEVTSIIPVA